MRDALPKFANEYEVIFVNDGSPDNSGMLSRFWRINTAGSEALPSAEFGRKRDSVWYPGGSYEVTVTMDQDLQHPPEEIQACSQNRRWF